LPKSVIDKVQELEKKHNLLADNLIDAIWILDLETKKYEYMTPSIEKISGYNSHYYINTEIKDHLKPESYRKLVELLKIQKGYFISGKTEVKKLELEFNHQKGHSYWIEIRSKIVQDHDNTLKAMGISRDITDTKKSEQVQNELVNKLNKALEEKEKLIQEIKVLSGLLPICSGCKRIRDENNNWWPLDYYVTKQTKSEMTHTVCPDCKIVIYSDELEKQR
jgi:PAS domain S-box-containing protein